MKTLILTGTTGTIKARQRIEQTIALVTAQALLDAGFLLGVNDGEETTLRYSRDLDKVQAALFTTDEDYLLVYEDADQDDPLNVVEDDRADYWVRFVYGNDGWDVISDYLTALEPYIGEGTVVAKLISHAEASGVVPDLHNRTPMTTGTPPKDFGGAVAGKRGSAY